MRDNRRYSSPFPVLVSYNPLTTRKLAQVPIATSNCGSMNPDLFTDAFKVIQTLGRVQRAFHAAEYDVVLIYAQRSQYSSRIKYSVNAISDVWICAESDFAIADPGATMTFVAGGALKPIGGHILSHASATRMFLRKGCFGTHNEPLY